MANIEEESLFYLTNINSLAEKISKDLTLLESINDSQEIDEESSEAESPLLNGENGSQDLSDVCVFPKYFVNCGEKIVIDFEHEGGWTWRDEHSGPFSWMTRSQQELNILDEVVNIHNTTIEDNEMQEQKLVLNSKTSDIKESNRLTATYKTSKRIFDSPFHAKERGVDALDGYNGFNGTLENYIENLAAADSSTDSITNDIDHTVNTLTKSEDEPIDSALENVSLDLTSSTGGVQDKIMTKSESMQSEDDFENFLEERACAKTGFDFLDNW